MYRVVKVFREFSDVSSVDVVVYKEINVQNKKGLMVGRQDRGATGLASEWGGPCHFFVCASRWLLFGVSL